MSLAIRRAVLGVLHRKSFQYLISFHDFWSAGWPLLICTLHVLHRRYLCQAVSTGCDQALQHDTNECAVFQLPA